MPFGVCGCFRFCSDVQISLEYTLQPAYSGLCVAELGSLNTAPVIKVSMCLPLYINRSSRPLGDSGWEVQGGYRGVVIHKQNP